MTATLAGDFDYDRHGQGYARQRRTDPRIAARVHAARVHAALGQARTVINVGAGAGSYEPEDRHVVAVEPSAAMRAQRPRHLAPALDAVAERLPFDDDSFDAAMATVTVHQGSDTEQGLRELRRVSHGPVVILTFDGDALDLLHRGVLRPPGTLPRPAGPRVPVGPGVRGRRRRGAGRRQAAARPRQRRLGRPLRPAARAARVRRLAPARGRTSVS